MKQPDPTQYVVLLSLVYSVYLSDSDWLSFPHSLSYYDICDCCSASLFNGAIQRSVGDVWLSSVLDNRVFRFDVSY